MSVSSVHFVSQDPLHSSAGAMSPIHVLASTNMDPLQDPRLRTHVSVSLYLMGSLQDPCLTIQMYLRILCKIHVFGFMSQHLRISGSSAKSMSPVHGLASTKTDPLQDPRLRTHVSACSFARSMSPDSCLTIFASQYPLQDPCLRISISASSYRRILCKIHDSGSMCPVHVLASTTMDPLQDPCLRIHVSASLLCISISSTRSMSSDSCLSIFVSQDPLQDPCLRFTA